MFNQDVKIITFTLKVMELTPTNVYCINLDTRPDRWVQVSTDFEGKPFTLVRVPAVPSVPGRLGLRETFMRIISDAQLREDPQVIVCEDDLYVRDWSALVRALSNAPPDFHILIGGNYLYGPCERVNNEWSRVHDFSGLQFTIIHQRAYALILTLKGTAHLDRQLGALAHSGVLRVYCMTPMLCEQRPSYSDIRKCVVCDKLAE